MERDKDLKQPIKPILLENKERVHKKYYLSNI